MKILGVDPGTRVAGWGIVASDGRDLALVAAGVVAASEEQPIEKRLRLVFDGLGQVLREHGPELVALEAAYYGKNARTAIRLGEGRGAALLAAALANVAVVELQPSLVKKAVTGHGSASKDQVRNALEATLRGTREKAAGLPLDATDAVALAVAAHARGATPGPRRRRGSRWTADDVARLGLRTDQGAGEPEPQATAPHAEEEPGA